MSAVVHGFRDLDRRVNVAGVILNRVGGIGHAILLREALEPLGIAVLGVLNEEDAFAWRERHLGLVPVVEQPHKIGAALERLAAAIEGCCDLEAIVATARSAPDRVVAPPPVARYVGRVRVALAAGPAFSFTYPENLALLAQAGAELAAFDPLVDPDLPEGCAALYAGGGFPEAFAPVLGDNHRLLRNVARAVAGGMVTWAECGGLLWLSQSLDGVAMVGALPARAQMTEGLTIGYRSALTRCSCPFGPAGLVLRGHEFHRSTAEPPGDALELTGRSRSERAGFASRTLFASYLHQHIAATPVIAEQFVATAVRRG